MTDQRDASPAGTTEDTPPEARILGWEPGLRARAVFDTVFILVGAGYLLSTLDLGVGTITQPGSGAFPVFAGALLVLMLAADLVRLLVTGAFRVGSKGRVPLRAVVVLGSIVLYLLTIEILGHAITATIVFALLLSVLGTRKWWMIAIIALVAGFGTDFLFTALLGLDLPTGVIEFGVDEWM
ncbi:MAG: tripartite tricarboxylate transporter TctB family protein [Euzebyales bacterium]|nr:tripartite tricarboxylate transporter TctB family protein [Euzebyales bacterium]